jgi:hypothetical protein
MIFLRKIVLNIGETNDGKYPLNIPIIKGGFEIELIKNVTFFV